MTDKQQKFISHCSRDWKAEIRVPAWLGAGENPLLGCKRPTSHHILTWWEESWGALCGPFNKDTNLIHEAFTFVS